MNQHNVFLQVIKHIPRTVFQGFVAELQADRGVRKFDSWSWFGSLLFSQLSGQDSLRALEQVFSHVCLSKFGFAQVKRSTFSDANKARSIELLERVLSYVQELAFKAPRTHRFSSVIKTPVLLLDSTFIELCLSLCPWAHYRKSLHGKDFMKVKHYAGVKLHTAVDLAGVLPKVVVIKAGTEKLNSDVTVAKELDFQAGTLTIADRAYGAAQLLDKINQAGAHYIVRVKAKAIKFKRIKSRVVDKDLGLICDQDVYYIGRRTKEKYSGRLRRIRYRDPDTGKEFTFLSNRFDLDAFTICELYRTRWRVESFFKTLKQQFRVKKFLGLNPNAVKAQILTALIAYTLCAYLKLTRGSDIPMHDLMATISTLLLVAFPLWKILTKPEKKRRKPPPVQLPLPL